MTMLALALACGPASAQSWSHDWSQDWSHDGSHGWSHDRSNPQQQNSQQPNAQSQQQESTPAQRQACEPDVYRLCKWYIPSHSAIANCLHQKIDQLSPACRAVMEGRLR